MRSLRQWRVLLLAGLALLGGWGASCSDRARPPVAAGNPISAPIPLAPVVRPRPDLRLVALTDLSGTLEPCGCTSKPKGGVERIAALVRELRADGVPTDVVFAGNTFFGPAEVAGHGASPETAHGGKRVTDQEAWKAEVIAQVLGGLGTMRVAPGGADRIAAGDDIDSLLRTAHAGGATGASPAHWVVDQADETVVVTSADAAALRSRFELADPKGTRPWLLLANGSRRFAKRLAEQIPGLDFVIMGGVDQPTGPPPSQHGTAFVLGGGRHGEGVLVVDVYLRDTGPVADWSDWSFAVRRDAIAAQIAELRAKIRVWDAEGKAADADVAERRTQLRGLEAEAATLATPTTVRGNAFNARLIAMEKSRPGDPTVREAMRAYDKRVNEHNRKVYANAVPAPVSAGQPTYVGSGACATCHEPANTWWRTTKHGVAYKTLVDVDKQFNLNCVGCHVTGYGMPGGATVTHNLEGELVDVGCETCHGPGSEHVAKPRIPGLALRDPAETVCARCHNKEHSDLFDFKAYRAMLIAPGHGAPAAASTNK